MIKYIFTFLLSFNCFASISLQNCQTILNKLTDANSMARINIEILNDNRVNAYGSPGYVAVTKGLFQFGNQAMLIAVLAHELGHAKGISLEVGADIESVYIAGKAGLNVCPGAKQFLLTIGKEGDGTHPPGIIRLKSMRCI